MNEQSPTSGDAAGTTVAAVWPGLTADERNFCRRVLAMTADEASVLLLIAGRGENDRVAVAQVALIAMQTTVRV